MNFFEKILSEFPILEDEFKDTEEYEIHYKMERIASYINKSIKERNKAVVFHCFDIIERYLVKDIDSKFENALYVSFCEPIYLMNRNEDEEWAENLMKRKLKVIYSGYRESYDKTLQRK